MKYLSNIAMLALAALTFESCSSTRPTSSTATIVPAVGDTRKPGYATSTASGNIVVGGTASTTATASISGASGNAMGNQPVGTMGTANTTSGIEGTSNSVGTQNDNAALTGIAGEAQRFVKMAGIGGMTQVELSQIALKLAQSTAVKQYASMIVKDYGRANTALKALAAAKGIAFPNRADLNQSAGGVAITDLKKSSAKEFDKKYVLLMIKDQEKGVAVFEQGSTSADPQVKTYASKYLPTLQIQLQTITALGKTISK